MSASTDFTEKKDVIDQGVGSLTTALEDFESIENLVRQLKGIASSLKSATGNQFSDLVTQFTESRTQISLLADKTLILIPISGIGSADNTGGAAIATTAFHVVITATGLSSGIVSLAASGAVGSVLEGSDFGANQVIATLDSALTTLRANASTIGGNVALLQTRFNFTETYVNVLETGSTKLTLADINEEGASLLALQTGQQLGINSQAFASQAEQGILALFR